MAGKFVIGKRSNGDFQFNLKAGNGQVILGSQGYADKAGCRNGIDSVKKNGADDARYERKLSTNNKFFFNLLAGNGQVIGTSEMYESESGRESGITSVKNNAPDADVVDETV
nr:YegP family protein [Pseudoxanthomonas sp.]